MYGMDGDDTEKPVAQYKLQSLLLLHLHAPQARGRAVTPSYHDLLMQARVP